MIFDCHAHIFPEQIVDRAMQVLSARHGIPPVARPTPEGLLHHMDECAVDRAMVVAVATRPERVAWGSDFPWQAASRGLAGVRRLGLSKEQRERLLGRNLERWLGSGAGPSGGQ